MYGLMICLSDHVRSKKGVTYDSSIEIRSSDDCFPSDDHPSSTEPGPSVSSLCGEVGAHEGQNGNQEQLAIPIQPISSVEVEDLASDDGTLIHDR